MDLKYVHALFIVVEKEKSDQASIRQIQAMEPILKLLKGQDNLTKV